MRRRMTPRPGRPVRGAVPRALERREPGDAAWLLVIGLVTLTLAAAFLLATAAHAAPAPHSTTASAITGASAPAMTAGPAPAMTAGPAPAMTAGPAPAMTAGPAPATTASPAPATTAGPAPAIEPLPRESGAQEPEHAGEQEHAGDEEHAGPTWTEMIFRWINFGLLAGLLWWTLVKTPPAIGEIFGFPGLEVVLASRARRIKESKAVAAREAEEAREILEESETRLARIEQEVEDLVTQARADAERERARAEEEGRAQAEKVRETASRELRAETVGAQRQLRAYVAELAVGIAERTLREQLTAADQQRLQQEYLSRIGGRVS